MASGSGGGSKIRAGRKRSSAQYRFNGITSRGSIAATSAARRARTRARIRNIGNSIPF